MLFVWIVLTRKLGRVRSQDRLDTPAADAGLDGRLPDCCPIVASLGEDL